MQDKYWNNHYKKFSIYDPTEFALHCIRNQFKSDDVVIELGCGNGRDAYSIAQKVSRYIGFDACNIAVASFKKNINNINPEISKKIEVYQQDFTSVDFDNLISHAKRLVFYSRFSYHSINYEEADRLLKNINDVNKFPWILMIEARTIFDNLYGEGENIGLHEFKTDHYRRFIDPENFFSEISASFSIPFFHVNSGYALYGDQDPEVMRVIIQKK